MSTTMKLNTTTGLPVICFECRQCHESILAVVYSRAFSTSKAWICGVQLSLGSSDVRYRYIAQNILGDIAQNILSATVAEYLAPCICGSECWHEEYSHWNPGHGFDHYRCPHCRALIPPEQTATVLGLDSPEDAGPLMDSRVEVDGEVFQYTNPALETVGYIDGSDPRAWKDALDRDPKYRAWRIEVELNARPINANGALLDHFHGALLGTMIGDAFGLPFESRRSQPPPPARGLPMLESKLGVGYCSDDSHMTMALAEALLETNGSIDPQIIARKFGEWFDPRRGYGKNVRSILADIKSGLDWQQVLAERTLPGGSYANGAAMRVAQIALAFYSKVAAIREAAAAQALVTGHSHPVAIFGAQLQALAIARAIQRGVNRVSFDARGFAIEMMKDCPDEFTAPLGWIADHLNDPPRTAAERLGTGGRAFQSVPAALWSFAANENDPELAVATAVSLGGDSDTIGAMTGAIAGAFQGARAFPRSWIDALEDGPRGWTHMLRLAQDLLELDHIGSFRKNVWRRLIISTPIAT